MKIPKWAERWSRQVQQPEIEEFLPSDESEAALLVESCNRVIGFTEHAFIAGTAQTAELTRWLLASLLAINIGGLAVLLATDALPLAATIAASKWLVSGAVFAILTGLSGILGFARISSGLGEVIWMFMRARIEVKLSADAQLLQRHLTRRARRQTVLTVGIGLASLFCFLAAAIRVYEATPMPPAITIDPPQTIILK